MMIVGIGMFGTLAASLTSALTAGRTKDIRNDELLERLELLERRLTGLIQTGRTEERAPLIEPSRRALW